MIFDGQGQSDHEFTKQVADSPRKFATNNLWLVDKIREKLDKNFFIIEKLQNGLRQSNIVFREKVNSELTQVKQGLEE